MAVSDTVISPVNPAPSSPLPPSVQSDAAAGYFRAIALWLNHPLANDGIYVQVQADQPGCLKLLVEFERPPIKERLLKFLCHRIWLLNSELIEGIYVLARPMNRRRVLWQQRIRIVTPAVKQRRQALRQQQLAQAGSPLPPPLRSPRPRQAHLSRHHLKLLRSFLLTGSAVAAFIFGCLLDVITAGSTPVLPSFHQSPSQANGVQPSSAGGQGTEPASPRPAVTTVNYQESQTRPSIVDTAVEPVGVQTLHQPSPAPGDDVTLLFGGDISLDHLAYDQIDAAGQLFAKVSDYQTADLSMVTLGSPLASGATNLEEELHDRTRLDAIDLLKESGVDIVNLSDESVMTFGEKGLDETLKALDRGGLYRVGAGRNGMEARRPEIIDVKGKRIAYLSYAQGGDNAAHDERGGVNAQSKLGIVKDIQALRSQVDWIVVNFRWQVDLPAQPASWQTNLARLAIDQGADVVVGYHPHQLQGAEIYKGRPIAYSLGDFVFENDQQQPVADQDTVVLKVALKDDQMKVEFVPVKIRNTLPETMTGAEEQTVLDQLQQASSEFETPMKSPMILDLKAKDSLPAKAFDPDSPFVNPNDGDILETPAVNPTPVDSPAVGESSTQTKPRSWFDFSRPDQDRLDNWGPKVSPKQNQFQPLPNKMENGDRNEVDAQLRHQQIWGPTKPSYPDPEVKPVVNETSTEMAPTLKNPVLKVPTLDPASGEAPTTDSESMPSPQPEAADQPLSPAAQSRSDQADSPGMTPETTAGTATDAPALVPGATTAQPRPTPTQPQPGTIAPHSEPLVGPLGSAPNLSSADEVAEVPVDLAPVAAATANPVVPSKPTAVQPIRADDMAQGPAAWEIRSAKTDLTVASPDPSAPTSTTEAGSGAPAPEPVDE